MFWKISVPYSGCHKRSHIIRRRSQRSHQLGGAFEIRSPCSWSTNSLLVMPPNSTYLLTYEVCTYLSQENILYIRNSRPRIYKASPCIQQPLLQQHTGARTSLLEEEPPSFFAWDQRARHVNRRTTPPMRTTPYFKKVNIRFCRWTLHLEANWPKVYEFWCKTIKILSNLNFHLQNLMFTLNISLLYIFCFDSFEIETRVWAMQKYTHIARAEVLRLAYWPTTSNHPWNSVALLLGFDVLLTSHRSSAIPCSFEPKENPLGACDASVMHVSCFRDFQETCTTQNDLTQSRTNHASRLHHMRCTNVRQKGFKIIMIAQTSVTECACIYLNTQTSVIQILKVFRLWRHQCKLKVPSVQARVEKVIRLGNRLPLQISKNPQISSGLERKLNENSAFHCFGALVAFPDRVCLKLFPHVCVQDVNMTTRSKPPYWRRPVVLLAEHGEDLLLGQHVYVERRWRWCLWRTCVSLVAGRLECCGLAEGDLQRAAAVYFPIRYDVCVCSCVWGKWKAVACVCVFVCPYDTKKLVPRGGL